MKQMNPCLSILVLTEDSGDDAFETLCHVVKILLKEVDRQTRTHEEKLALLPLRSQTALQSLKANVWKSDKPEHRRNRVDLVQTIATHIMKDECSWVFFHFDGDRPWARRASSENSQKFKTHILEQVFKIVEGSSKVRSVQFESKDELRSYVDSRMSRVKRIVPFYSIEAWLYQNSERAIDICHKYYRGRHADRFERWRDDRSLLDELEKTKEQVCLGSKYNLMLVSSSYPVREVREVGKSFAATVQELCDDESLREALRQTYGA